MSEAANFSLVSATAEYAVEIEISDHEITLYELDGYPIDVKTAKRLYLQPGETAKIGISKNSNSVVDPAVALLRASLPGNLG